MALLLTACAEQPLTMTYWPEQEQRYVWPRPPEVPRYQYVGQLLGETNFKPANPDRAGGVKSVLRWVVGLGADKKAPVVLERPQTGVVIGDRILVTDMGRKAVMVFDEVQGNLSLWDRSDRNNGFIAPIGICAGANNEVLVADAELGRIMRLDMSGNPLGSFGEGLVSRPTGLACDSETGRVYVADTGKHDIKVFLDNGAFEKTIGLPGSARGEFNAPTHLWFRDGKLYVSDTLNARVQVLDLDSGANLSIGKRGLYVGNLVRPKGVAADDDGNIYVVEGYYDHLLIYSNDGRLLLSLGGTGSNVGQFFLPTGIWIDRNRVFVADMFNGRVMIFQYLGG